MERPDSSAEDFPDAQLVDRRRGARSRLSLEDYIELRLGRGARRQAVNWFTRSWGAPSFADFWVFFNPVYGYGLSYFVYRPFRRFLPRYVAVFGTFLVSGFVLHDAVGWLLARQIRFPEMTLVFGLFGVGAIVSRATGIDLGRTPFLVRASVNLSYVVGCFELARLLH
jgi:hypothetical protein